MMKLINIPLTKWATSGEQLKAIWKSKGQRAKAQTQFLGVNWNTESDYLYIDSDKITNKFEEGPTTNRKLLQTTASFYDPLGLFSAVTLIVKILFKDIWCRGINWDELLPTDLGTRWHTWVSGLPSLSQVHVPRWLAASGDGNTKNSRILWCFRKRLWSDSLRSYDQGRQHPCPLACSKNRLAPVRGWHCWDWSFWRRSLEQGCWGTSARRQTTLLRRNCRLTPLWL